MKKKNKRARSSRPIGAITNTSFHKYLASEGISLSVLPRVSEYLMIAANKKTAAARKIIQDLVIEATEPPDARVALAVAESESLLNGYATLDEPHRAEIQSLIDQITTYLGDATRKRPLNALMLASPGAGKSYFIKQLAGKMKNERVQAVTFNMATMRSADDMAQPIDELRNLKVNDRFPLLFLDEFDSDPSRYAALLPLLWDGELHLGHRDLKLGKAVIVLAGSNPDLPKTMDHSSKMQREGDALESTPTPGKLIDLLSRINGGVINIPDLDLRSEDRDRRVDKVCAAISLTKLRFGPKLVELPRALLRLVAHTQFRYGLRSIAHLVDIINVNAFRDGKLALARLDLPVGNERMLQESSLRLHILDKDQAFGVVSRWKQYTKDSAIVDLRASNTTLWWMRKLRGK